MALVNALIAAFVASPAPVPIGDEVAPSVTIDAPLDGKSFVDVPTSIEIQIIADDGMGLGVRDVRLQIGGELLPNEDTQAPYELDVELPRGTWILMAVARDWAGNIGRSTPVVVEVGPIEADTSGGETEATPVDTSASTGAANESSGGDSEIADGDISRGCTCAAEPSSPLWIARHPRAPRPPAKTRARCLTPA